MQRSRRAVLTAGFGVVTGLAGCTESADSPESTGPAGTPALPVDDGTAGYTHLRPSGNRTVSGAGAIDDARPVDIAVDGQPSWLLAFGGEGSYWTVVTEDGTATTYRVREGASDIVTDHGTVSTPPLGFRSDDGTELLGPSDSDGLTVPDDCADHTHPVVVDGGLLYVATDGDVVIWRGEAVTRLDLSAPVDARPVRVGQEQYAVYGGATDRYQHGALGDTVEPSTLAVVDTASEAVETTITLDSPTVFEGLWPQAADLTGDGTRELLTTVADSSSGARIRVYDTDGAELATGPIYGSGWRHQLCVAPFGPGGDPALAVVRKPHVDFTVEFYRLDDEGLNVTAARQGYSTHTYGSRNIDGALAGDLDGDGRPELLVPVTARERLDAVRRTPEGTTLAWSLSLGGTLTTNVTGIALDDGSIAVGAGTVDGIRVWQG